MESLSLYTRLAQHLFLNLSRFHSESISGAKKIYSRNEIMYKHYFLAKSNSNTLVNVFHLRGNIETPRYVNMNVFLRESTSS